MSKIAMDDLWENYSFILHKNGDESNNLTTVKVKDLFEMLRAVEEDENDR